MLALFWVDELNELLNLRKESPISPLRVLNAEEGYI